MEKNWDPGDVAKAVMVAWALWTNRNEVRHGKKRKESKAVVYGALDYLQFARDMLIHDFILEGDSLLLVNALNEVSPPPSAVAAIVYSSLSALKDFRKVEISHVKRY